MLFPRPRTDHTDPMRVLPLAGHRYTSIGVVFSLLTFLGSFLLALYFPLSASSSSASPASHGVGGGSDGSVVVDDAVLARDACYYGWFLCWTGRYIPQFYLNYSRGRSSGLSLDFLVWDLLGTGCNFLSTVVTLQYVEPVRKRQGARLTQNPAEDLRRLIFVTVAFGLCSLVTGYSSWLNMLAQEVPSPAVKAAAVLIVILSVIFLVVMLSTNVSVSHVDSVSGWCLVLVYCYIALSLARFVPQLRRNHKHRLVLGVDLSALSMDAIGGACLVLYVFFSCPGTASVNATQSSSSSVAASSLSRTLTANVPLLIHGAGVFFMSTALIAQSFYYWKLPASHLRRAIEAYKNCTEDHGAFIEFNKPGTLVIVGGGGGGEDVDEATLGGIGLMGDEQQQWVCCRCTLHNELSALQCAVCHMSREESLTSDPKAWFLGVGGKKQSKQHTNSKPSSDERERDREKLEDGDCRRQEDPHTHTQTQTQTQTREEAGLEIEVVEDEQEETRQGE